MKPTLLVLAAGMGSRYGGLKQIDPVGPSGEIIIDYSIFDALRSGFGKVVFVIRKDIEPLFKECVGSRFEGKIAVGYAYQELDMLPAGIALPSDRKKPWGTGHAILVAKDKVKEPFVVINADDFYGHHGYSLMAEYLGALRNDSTDYGMVGFILRNTLSEHGSVARGVCAVDKGGFLADVEEITKIEKEGSGAKCPGKDGASDRRLSGDETVSMNMWGFTPSIFAHLESQFRSFLATGVSDPKSEFFIPTVVNNLVKSSKARVRVLQSRDSWFGITYKEDKPVVVASIRELVGGGAYPGKLF